jgi:hypothetical protein
MADTKKEIIMVTALRLTLISVVVGLFMAVPPVYADRKKHSTSKIWTLAENKVVHGARSSLVRHNDEICMNIDTRRLPEGVNTIWLSVFNNPEHCTAPAPVGGARCGGDDDFANPAVNAAFLWATGGIVGPDGVGYFSTCLAENQDPGGPGLTDAQGAEIHLFVRSHCEAQYGNLALLGAQLTMFGGGCIPPPEEEEGEFAGPCPCATLQFAIHPSKTRHHDDE